MFQLADYMQNKEHDTLCTAGFTWKKCNRDDFFLTSNIFEKKLHSILAGFTGKIGCYSRIATRKLIKKIDQFQPDIIHLHNLHGWFVNLPMLFRYIKKHNIRVVWTLHDCWSFTGHCAHFDMIGCDKWKKGCYGCPQYKEYPESHVDNSKKMYSLKQKWFTGVENLTIVTPSQWLGNLVKQSFLKDYPVQVINNGIDLSVFKPVASDFRKKYNCENKYILLGVAYAWDEKKGLDVFLKLAESLGENYQIVLVGTDDSVDQKLPKNIISIHRTQNPEELAAIYTAADLFVNPTREENYPTVNMEAIACGTPVLTFRTGGSPEIVNEFCGSVVDKNDIEDMQREIIRICTEKIYSAERCVASAGAFDFNCCLTEYEKLYRRLI